MKKLKKIQWNSKEMRFGGYSIAATSLLLCFLIILNLIFSSLNIKFDLTEEKFFSLSSKTEAVLANLTDPVTIYVLEETGLENKDFQDIFKNYEKASDKLSVIYKDPVLYPQFAQQYMDVKDEGANQPIASGSVIVENAVTKKYRTILSQEMYNIGFSQQYGPYVQSLAIEEKVTGAIDYVSSDEENRILVTDGHGEYSIPFGMFDKLEKENFIVENINLLTDELAPNPNDTLLIYSPHVDFQDTERDKILEFLESGGKAMIFTDFNTPDLPNFNQILTTYGVTTVPGVVIEGNSKNMLNSSPNFLIPELLPHDTTNLFLKNKLPIVMPLAGALTQTEHQRQSLTITPVISSSDNSWIKTNLDSQTTEKELGDIDGPAHMAYAIEDINTLNPNEPLTTKLMVISNTLFLDNRQFKVASTANMEWVMSSFLWLQDKENTPQMDPKSFASYTLPAMSSTTFLLLTALSLIVLPLIVIVWGGFTWMKRRNL